MPSPLSPTSPTTLQNMLAVLRRDLMDLNSAAYVWTDAVLYRCIDLALERYSQVAPRVQLSQLQSVPNCRIYPVPDGAWYLDKVEYPVGFWPKRFVTFVERPSPLLPNPSAAPIVAAGAGAGALSGTYLYACSFVSVLGVSPTPETQIGPPSGIVTFGAQTGTGFLSQIPTGPYGTLARNLYRTRAGVYTTYYFLAQLADNTSSTYTDTIGDAQLGASAPTSNTTQGIRTAELQLDPSRLPPDNSSWLELSACYKHELDPLGTTVPEQHLDAIALGAKAFALYAYLTTANDNFDYVDGQFRDRVDDSKAPEAWRTHANETMQQFHQRLEAIKHESNAQIMPNVQWGDKPYRWDRL